MLRKFTRSIKTTSKLANKVQGVQYSHSPTIKSVTYVEQPQEDGNEFPQEEFEAYKNSIPVFENASYQEFLSKANSAKQKTLTSMEEKGSQLSEDSQRKVEIMTQLIGNMSDMEIAYFEMKMEDQITKMERIHPLVYNLDLTTDVPIENEEYVHPINFFLQQKAMNMLWADRAGMSFGGGAGGAGAGAGGEADVEVEPEQTAFDVVLKGLDAKMKLKAIKEAKNILGLGLKEAKELMTQTGVKLKEKITREEAEELAEKFGAVGCEIEIQ